jgi:hypothetical protein
MVKLNNGKVSINREAPRRILQVTHRTTTTKHKRGGHNPFSSSRHTRRGQQGFLPAAMNCRSTGLLIHGEGWLQVIYAGEGKISTEIRGFCSSNSQLTPRLMAPGGNEPIDARAHLSTIWAGTHVDLGV